MDKLLIRGGRPLHGEVSIAGAKNAALPALCAALLTTEKVTLTNVPQLQDVSTMLKLIRHMGVQAEPGAKGEVQLHAAALHTPEAPYELVKTMRASVLALGPLLARMGHAKVSLPGGCAIGSRPVDQHIKGLQAMGAIIDVEHGYMVARLKPGQSRLKGARIATDMVRPHLQPHPHREPAPLLPAATVLLLRDGAHGLEVLMTRRSMKASFAPGAYVFPGGGIDAADVHARRWVMHFLYEIALPFGRGALEKLKITPEVSKRYEYKSAAEMMGEYDATPANREMTESLLDDLFQQLVTGIAERRKLAPETVQALIDRAPLLDKESLDAGVKALERAVCDHGFIGAHFYPHWFELPPDHARWYPFYAKCVELDIAALCTNGVPGPRLPYEAQFTGLVDEVCWFFPELKFVMRHGADPWVDLAVKLMLKYPNLYYSTSAWAPRRLEEPRTATAPNSSSTRAAMAKAWVVPCGSTAPSCGSNRPPSSPSGLTIGHSATISSGVARRAWMPSVS